MSNSTVGKFDVWKHALLNYKEFIKEFDIYVDIDCTNPLITIEDISGTLNKFYKLRENVKVLMLSLTYLMLEGILTLILLRKM